MYRLYFKRFFDFFYSLILLIILSPLFIFIAFLCIIFFKGKIFFTQKRVGKNEKIFTIVKFISMKPLTEKNITDASRTSRFGSILRKSSMDEIPQLLNVLIGDMSLIGPRPLLVKYLPYYSVAEKTRHQVRPGITGLAQINGRNNLSWDHRLQFDIQYVKNLSLDLDLKIFIKTIVVTFSAKNIQADVELNLQDLDVERINLTASENNNSTQ